jgi:TolA-binding protein
MRRENGVGEENQTDDRRQIDQKRFRVDTTINIAHILTTVAMILAIFSWGSDLKATVQKHEFEIQDVKSNVRYDRDTLREELRELNRKIDKISERVGAGPNGRGTP